MVTILRCSIKMHTLRNSNTDYNSFNDEVKYIIKTLSDFNYDTKKFEVEFAIYNTNCEYDSKWLNN